MLQAKARAWVEIDMNAVEHNTREVQRILPESSTIMAVVKANCYGHGDVEISKRLVECGIQHFAVSSVDEAVKLRNTGINEMILILGYVPSIHYHYLIEYDLVATVISYEYGLKLSDFAISNKTQIKVHIKVDTGMARLGIRMLKDDYNLDKVLAVLQLNGLNVEGVFSHFSVSDSLLNEDDLAYTKQQISMFDRVLADLKEHGYDNLKTHMSNSYGVLNYPNLPYDYVRPGLLLVGVTSDDSIAINTDPLFIPALSFYANVSCVKTVHKGSCVSYGRHYRATSDRVIATVSCGYADGLPRAASNQGMSMLIHGQRAQVIGNICMDQCLIDVTDIKNVKEGDLVTIVGKEGQEQIKIDEWTRCVHSINNDLLCMISARVPRFYINQD